VSDLVRRQTATGVAADPVRYSCYEVVPSSRLPLRVGLGAGAVAIAVVLITAATRISRSRPELA
jgi:hypothetical protein